MQTKSEIRASCRNIRREMTDERLAECSEEIVRRLLALPAIREADAILTYSPIGRELQIEPIAQFALMHGIPLFYPICNTENCTVRFLQITSEDQLHTGTYGICEPIADLPDYDSMTFSRPVIVVPGLAFSRSGHRLGYGKGYYDRFLQNHRITSVGAVIHSCLYQDLPHTETDIPVDVVITEKGAFHLGQSIR